MLAPVIALALALAFGAPVAPAAVPAAPAAPATARGPAGAVIARINIARARQHLRPLRADARLARSAHAHAVSMARYGLLTHDTRSGEAWNRRVARSAHTHDVGEVLAALRDVSAASEARIVVRAWLRSHEHRVVLLTRRYRRIGVGRAWMVRGGHRRTVYTVDFAAR